MGGVKSEQCNSLAKLIWKWCINRSIWLSASHIPGINNEADFESRNFKDNVEWKLSSRIFHTITEIWGHPDVDMFASILNKQVDRFVSWHPDPDCIAVDAFSLTWSNELIYAFPPFSLIGRLVQKLRQDQGEMILVAPVWLTPGWFTAVMELLIDLPRIFKVQQGTLSLTYSDRIHPLINHLHLMVCRLSGKSTKAGTFWRQLQMSSCPPGELLQKSNIPHILTDGFYTVIKGKLINFLPL